MRNERANGGVSEWVTRVSLSVRGPQSLLRLKTSRASPIRTRHHSRAHSAMSDAERAREWWRVRMGDARVVVGTRSAIFAPLENVGLIIVDEEQETSYKQEDTPRYHGRDVAIVRAKMENAVALLGSATPSMESYYHARSEEHTSELQSRSDLVCRLLLE